MRKLLHSHLEMENHCFLGFAFYHLKPTAPKFSQLTGTWHTRTLIFTYFKRMISCPIFTKKHTKRHSPNCNPQTKSLTKHLQGKRKERGGDTGEATSGAQKRRVEAGAPRRSPAPRLGRPLPSQYPLLPTAARRALPLWPRPKPRPAADVSCYVSVWAVAAEDPLVPRRRQRPLAGERASGTAAGTRAAHPSGASAA